MFWRRKKTGRPVDGPRPDLVLPEGDWPAPALTFHEAVNRVVSVVMADDETLLEPLPAMPRDRRTSYYLERNDTAKGFKYETDDEGEGGYTLRNSSVSWVEASDETRKHYCVFYYAWLEQRTEDGSVKGFRYPDQAGEQVCWRLGEDDFLGIRLEPSRLQVSATRAWVDEPNRKNFDNPAYYKEWNWTRSIWKWTPAC